MVTKASTLMYAVGHIHIGYRNDGYVDI